MFQGINLLEQGLNAAWLRNEVISNNLANVDTPGYKSSSVEFESMLADALGNTGITGRQTREKHLPIGSAIPEGIEPVVRQNSDTTMRMDGNNVDIDKEMSELAMNSIYYNALIQKISGELSRIRMAVQEGR